VTRYVTMEPDGLTNLRNGRSVTFSTLRPKSTRIVVSYCSHYIRCWGGVSWALGYGGTKPTTTAAPVHCPHGFLYDTIEEFNVDSEAEYSA